MVKIYEPDNNINILTLCCYGQQLNKIYNKKNYTNIKISNIVGKLKYYWNKFKYNNELIRLLFSQQAYEYYKYYTIHKNYQIDQILNNISQNSLVDINHIVDNNNIFSLSLKMSNKIEMISKLKLLNAKFPESTTIVDIINNCDINMRKELSIFFITSFWVILKIYY